MTATFTSKLAAVALTLLASATLLIGTVGPATSLAHTAPAARIA
ncbi:hypothetical protein [Sphingomonas sp. Leaf412]|nr:hypothetical protein [Sphingomonas sp. Leaf412]